MTSETDRTAARLRYDAETLPDREPCRDVQAEQHRLIELSEAA